MDAFEAKYWSKIQALLWVLTRRKEPVCWAAFEPGRTPLSDLSLGADGLDHEDLDDNPPYFGTEEELIAESMRYGSVMSLDDARMALIRAEADGRLRAYAAPSGRKVFDRVAILDLWAKKSDVREQEEQNFPGRPPKCKRAIELEHQRRLKAGEALAELPDEAQALIQWAARTYRDAEVPTLKTVRNNIRASHRKAFPRVPETK